MPVIPVIRSILLGAALLGCTGAYADDWREEGVSRVVAIADIHGAYDAMVETLQQAGILSDDKAWAGADARLVIAGDVLDRGPDSRAAMDLLMRLEGEAEKAGGRVHMLIGNHESMLLLGDMRYVSAAEYAAFADAADDGDREAWLQRYATRNSQEVDAVRAEFDEKFPRGYFAMRKAFRADGHYGKWLIDKKVMVVIDDTVFVHGGLPPAIAEIGLDAVNGELRREFREFVRALNVLNDAGVILPTDSHYDYATLLGSWTPSLSESPDVLEAVKTASKYVENRLTDRTGPLWYRENVACPAAIEGQRLQAALAAVGAERLVVGHTPTPTRKVLSRFDGRLVEIDTGMLGSHYRGSGNALIIEGDSVSTINQDGSRTSRISEHPRRVGRRQVSLSVEKLEDLLRDGEIVSVEKEKPSSARITPLTIVEISDGERTVKARFSRRQGREFYPAVAAYRVDRMLGVGLTPVTVTRDVNGRAGSLQFVPESTIDEASRNAQRLGGNAACPLPVQWSTMALFDYLVNAKQRTAMDLVYDKATWQLILLGNVMTFSDKRPGKPAFENVPTDLVNAWSAAVAGLTDEMIDEQLVGVLDKRRLRDLRKRRDQIAAMRPSP